MNGNTEKNFIGGLLLWNTVGEGVRIGEDSEIYVESIMGNRVRLRFKVPKQYKITRIGRNGAESSRESY